MYEIKRKQRNKQTKKKNNSHGYYRTTAYPTFSGAKSNYPPGKSPMSSFTSSIVVYLKFGPTRKYTSHPSIEHRFKIAVDHPQPILSLIYIWKIKFAFHGNLIIRYPGLLRATIQAYPR